jgi:8-oxo-dGTP pyrophosphatase MutT (NUDIX family)
MSTTTYFVAAVAAVIFKEGRVLSMKHSVNKDAGPGIWETLSGRIDAGEEPLDAVKREIMEESSLEVEIDPRPVTAYQATRMGEPMILLIYRADYKAGEVEMSPEHDDFAWLTPDEFAEKSSLNKLVDVVYKAAEM